MPLAAGNAGARPVASPETGNPLCGWSAGGTGRATVGSGDATGTAVAAMRKSSPALSEPSLASTLTSIETKPAGGTPLNVPVTGSKASHAGSGEPSARVAESASTGVSASPNVPAGSA